MQAKMDVALLTRWQKSEQFAPAFLESLDVSEVDPGVAALRSSLGSTALHAVAGNLFFDGTITGRGYTGQNKQIVDAFVQDLLSRGADWNAVDDFGDTPLRDFIYLSVRQRLSLKSLLQVDISAWASLVHDAGADLLEYAENEKAAWQGPLFYSWFETYGLKPITTDDVITGEGPVDWKLVIKQDQIIHLYQLRSTPGSWPVYSRLPSTICWSPNEEQHLEGGWQPVRETLLPDKVISTVHRFDLTDARLVEYYRPQDDMGKLASLLSKTLGVNNHRQRSKSQPPEDKLQKHDQLAEVSHKLFGEGRSALRDNQYRRYRRLTRSFTPHWWLPEQDGLHLCDLGYGTSVVVGEPNERMEFSHRACLQDCGHDVVGRLTRAIKDSIRRHRDVYKARMNAEKVLREIG